MNSGVCVCALLAALSVSCLARQHLPLEQEAGNALPSQMEVGLRVSRSESLAGPVKPLPIAEDQADTRANLSELLARLISRKGGDVGASAAVETQAKRKHDTPASSRRAPVPASGKRGSTVNHRIKDRDYLGWMDFGRRSAEEYEYSS
uniref:Cholecystokinin n=1 Tax=Astyanax mexicanus TaxID=7994 RepID=A0A3B1J585_ASTMX